MPNPYLPKWEYIPDGEPRVFGDRVYVYGSHDKAASASFCDYKLKVWSASIHNLSSWTCHGDAFHTRADRDHSSDVAWTTNELFAPDVVEKDGKYYLYAYIVGAKGCVAVSEHPEGPFTLVSTYQYNIDNHYDNGTFIDPGVFVDDDGRVYIYCGYLGSYMAEINPENMYEIMDGTYFETIIPVDAPYNFFEACSMRKIQGTYYLIYSPKSSKELVYATSNSPRGPFVYRGCIVDNGIEYPAGNNHGSICKIKDQWYIFYHRMTNGTCMSRRGCVEKITILPDGSIPQVEMTSLGFEDSLSPYEITTADTACVLMGGCFITQKNLFERVITGITYGSVMGWKYFDFGEDYSSHTMLLHLRIHGTGCNSIVHVLLDHYETGSEIGTIKMGPDSGVYTGEMTLVTGRHAIFFCIEEIERNFFHDMLRGRAVFELQEFVFEK